MLDQAPVLYYSAMKKFLQSFSPFHLKRRSVVKGGYLVEVKRFTEISVHCDSDVSVLFTIRFDENSVRFGSYFIWKKCHKNARKMTKRNEKKAKSGEIELAKHNIKL